MTENRYLSKRLYLREMSDEDVTDRYLSWFRDKHVVKFLESKNFNRESVLDYLHDGRQNRKWFLYAICLRETDLHIGNIKIGLINWKHKLSDLSVVIGERSCWRRGLAQEALRMGTRLAFEVYDIRKLSGVIYEDNIASIKCYVGAGWVIEGRLKAHYLVEGKVMDQIRISCFNPRYFGSPDGDDARSTPKPRSKDALGGR